MGPYVAWTTLAEGVTRKVRPALRRVLVGSAAVWVAAERGLPPPCRHRLVAKTARAGAVA